MAICSAAYRVPAAAPAGATASISCNSRSVNVTSTAPMASLSLARLVVPTRGTTSSPRAATHAIASCATVTPLFFAISLSFSTSARFWVRLSPWNRGVWLR